MARSEISAYLRLFDSAFNGTDHSLIKNLETVDDGSWQALPQGARRTIKDITAHVGMFKYMYPGSAFRTREYDYGDDPVTPPPERLATVQSAIEWLTEAHEYLITAFSELEDDSELDKPRLAHWGDHLPTRSLMNIVLEHDTYHAGEINRTRALLQDDDDWPDHND